MWFGACTSQIGTFMQQFAQSWLVFDMTKDPFYLGLDVFLGQLPIMMFSLVGGVFADRIDRRKLLLASQFIQMTCAFALTGLFYFKLVHVWHILTLSFIVGLGQSMGGPAYSALLPSLVDSKDLSNAISMNSIQFNLARIVGPTVGGLAYANLGAAWCFGLNGLSFLAVICSLYMIHVKFIPAKSSEPIWSAMKEGIRFIRNREGLEPLVVLAFCMTMFAFALLPYIQVFVREVFKKGPETYTLLLVCSGAGSVCGGLVVAWMGQLKRQGRSALLIITVMGAAILGFSISHWLPLSCALIFLTGATMMSSATLLLSLVQLIVSDNMRGRVMSVYNLAFRSGMPMGGLVLGKLIPTYGLSLSVGCAGSALVGLALYFLLVNRRVAAL
jgi:predicted MFS family arabinose efflux permease